MTTTKTKKHIGIFSGTFDPFTVAHEAIIKTVLDNSIVDEIIIVPTIISYHRKDKDGFAKESWLSRENRQTVIEYFVKRLVDEGYKVSIDFCEYIYASKNFPENINKRRYLDTLDLLRSKYNLEEYNIYTIIGSDEYASFKSWSKYSELLAKTKLVVINGRDGTKIRRSENIYALVDIPEEYRTVSATNIRKEFTDAAAYLSSVFKTDVTLEHIVFKLPIFDLVIKHNANISFDPIGINSPDWAAILVEKDGKFLMVEQLRYGIMQKQIEFPCGMVESTDESPLKTACRELREETGFVVDEASVVYLGSDFTNPAFMNNKMHYYYVNLDTAKYDEVETAFDDHENIKSVWSDKADVLNSFKTNLHSVFMTNLLFRYSFYQMQNVI